MSILETKPVSTVLGIVLIIHVDLLEAHSKQPTDAGIVMMIIVIMPCHHPMVLRATANLGSIPCLPFPKVQLRELRSSLKTVVKKAGN